MRLVILIIVAMLVVLSLSTTIIQNFTAGSKTATSSSFSWSDFSFLNVYTPYKGDNGSAYQKQPENVQSTPEPEKPAPVKIYVDPNQSIFKGKLRISNVSGNSLNASDEYLTISNNTSNESVDITGFTIENSSNERFLIPRGYNLPGYGATPENEIILSAGGRANIRVGKQERQMNFRENLCTGYFNQSSNFNNTLSNNCPKPDISKMLNLKDECINTLNSIPTCRMMDTTKQVDFECNQFANEHYSYVGCVNDFQSRKDFYTNNWLIWMQRTGEFFRNLHEKIILKDQSGKIVDEYSY